MIIWQKKAVVKDAPQAKELVLTATNIDDALDLLSITTDKSNTIVDRHPERRAKAAYIAFEERELPRLREENKGLRLTQVKQILWKEWQKSPENPFNQAALNYDATQEEQQMFLQQQKEQIENRLKEK